MHAVLFRRPGPQPDRRRHGDLRRARLEPDEGLAGHGPGSQNRPEKGQ